MAVETDGVVQIKGENGPGLPVKVRAESGRLRLISGQDLVGDWSIGDLGISALHDGFSIRAEGEEFTLRADDDALLAEEFGVAAASPRMARKVAALHNPDEPEPEVDAVAEPKSNVLAIVFAVGGLLVLLGGTFLQLAPTNSATQQTLDTGGREGGAEFWIAFVIGGVLMVAVAFVMSVGARWARALSLIVVTLIVVLFGWVITQAVTSASYLTAYGFIAGGLVVGVGVLFSGSVGDPD